MMLWAELLEPVKFLGAKFLSKSRDSWVTRVLFYSYEVNSPFWIIERILILCETFTLVVSSNNISIIISSGNIAALHLKKFRKKSYHPYEATWKKIFRKLGEISRDRLFKILPL